MVGGVGWLADPPPANVNNPDAAVSQDAGLWRQQGSCERGRATATFRISVEGPKQSLRVSPAGLAQKQSPQVGKGLAVVQDGPLRRTLSPVPSCRYFWLMLQEHGKIVLATSLKLYVAM